MGRVLATRPTGVTEIGRGTGLIVHAEFLARVVDVMPLPTLDEFFDGNVEEESIAPDQWGYDRPPIAELRRRFVGIEARADVAWVRVQPHPDAVDLDVCAEAVAVCTAATASDMEVDVEGLEASGVIPGPVDEYRDVPAVPEGFAILSVVWD